MKSKEEILEQSRKNKKLRYAKRLTTLLCQRCDSPSLLGSPHCRKHLDYLNEITIRRRKRRKKNNLCIDCGIPINIGLRCMKHALQDNERHKKSRKKTNSNANLREKYRKEGRCPYCSLKMGEQDKGYKTCFGCRSRSKSKARTRITVNRGNRLCNT